MTDEQYTDMTNAIGACVSEYVNQDDEDELLLAHEALAYVQGSLLEAALQARSLH